VKNRCIEPCLLVVREKAQKEGAGGCGKGGKEDAGSGREEEKAGVLGEGGERWW